MKVERNFQKKKKRALNQSDGKIQSLLLLEEHRLGTQGILHTGVYKREQKRKSDAVQCASARRVETTAPPGLASVCGLSGKAPGEPAHVAHVPRVPRCGHMYRTHRNKCFPGPRSWGTLGLLSASWASPSQGRHWCHPNGRPHVWRQGPRIPEHTQKKDSHQQLRQSVH